MADDLNSDRRAAGFQNLTDGRDIIVLTRIFIPLRGLQNFQPNPGIPLPDRCGGFFGQIPFLDIDTEKHIELGAVSTAQCLMKRTGSRISHHIERRHFDGRTGRWTARRGTCVSNIETPVQVVDI